VFERRDAEGGWTASTLTEDDVLRMEEIGIEVPVAEFYLDVELSGTDGQNSTAGDNGAPRR